MKPLFLPMGIVAALTGAALSAPTTDIGAEFHLPFEHTNGFALVDKATGQLRIVHIDGGNNIVPSPPLRSDLPGITGASSGFLFGGNEQLVLASPTGNRLALVDHGTGSSSFLFPSNPGPALPVFHKAGAAAPEDLFLVEHLTAGGHTIEFRREPAGAFSLQDTDPGYVPILNYQPLNGVPSLRMGTGGTDDGADFDHFITWVNAGTVATTYYGTLAGGTRLASNVRRDDNELLLVGFVPGSTNLDILRVDTPLATPPTVDPVVSRAAPFAVGSVATAFSSLGSPDGIFITAADGSEARHYRIDAVNNLALVQSFAPPGADPILGLLPSPGRGLALLSGPAGNPATRMDFFNWAGAWQLQDTATLPTLLPEGLDFATLFWYDAEPLVAPFAQLLELDLQPDWTSKSPVARPADLPGSYFYEEFSNPTDGLDNPVIFAPTAPAGSTHVVTNQYLDSVSLTACADDTSLLLPSLVVTPPSDTYTEPVTASAVFDADLFTVFYREDGFGATWRTYDLPIPVSYPSTWQFYAQNKTTLTNGPVVSRTYQFATSDFATFDRDQDFVPDYVEAAMGLSPNSGADADADTFTDLDEIINNSDAGDDAAAPATPTYPFTGEGFVILAQALDQSSNEASDGDPNDATNVTDGEPVDLHTMTSALLASAPVEVLGTPPSLVGNLAATLNAGTPVPDNEWVILSTPVYWNLDGADPETRGGRETHAIRQRPKQAPPPINPVLTGTDLAADAAAWVAAANAAYAGFEQTSTITELVPVDTALSALAEAALYNALRNLAPAEQGELCVPQNGPADTPPAPTTVAISPDATYLRVNSDPSAQAAAAIELAPLGLAAGDIILIRTAGGYARNGADPEDSADLVGVFSASSTILPGNNSNRIPGAIDAGENIVTPPTSIGAQETDIPEDFLISTAGDNPYFDPIANPADPPFPAVSEVCLTIPDGATHLFVSTVSDFFGDNSTTGFTLEIFSSQFTLFGNRDADSERSPLTEAMLDALVADGLSLEQLLTIVGGASTGDVETVANAIYDFHVAHSDPTAPEIDVIPLLPLPLDVLRGLVDGDGLQPDYAAGNIVAPAVLADAEAALAAALASLPNAYRPTDTLTIEVVPPLTPDANYSYTNLGTLNPVAFFDSEGDPFQLDQGLGLALGSRFSVTGYTDVSGPPGHDAMELISLDVLFTPTPSDSDTNGNLLGDDWELFFFGELGAVAPFDTHPINGFTYLQLFLIGHDPRADCAEIPAESMVEVGLDQITIVKIAPDEFAVQFNFPEDYFEFFDFQVRESATLGPFSDLATGDPVNVDTDLYQIGLGVPASTLTENFFNLLMSLK